MFGIFFSFQKKIFWKPFSQYNTFSSYATLDISELGDFPDSGAFGINLELAFLLFVFIN